jgi:hypothetical protein
MLHASCPQQTLERTPDLVQSDDIGFRLVLGEVNRPGEEPGLDGGIPEWIWCHIASSIYQKKVQDWTKSENGATKLPISLPNDRIRK